MLNLPKATEVNKALSKKSIYTKFNLNSADKYKFDEDIKKIVIANEISPVTTNIQIGETIPAFFVLHIVLKKAVFNEKNLILISKLINQKMVLALEFENKIKLAVYHYKLIQSDWKTAKDQKIELKGLNLDTVWENMLIQIGVITLENNNSVEEQIKLNEVRQKLGKQILNIERQARVEKQPKRKLERVEQIRVLKKELEGDC